MSRRTPAGALLLLLRVRAATGETNRIPLTGGDGGRLPNADGILLRGRTPYVVQNRLTKVALVRVPARPS
jgi:hypothetical protein